MISVIHQALGHIFDFNSRGHFNSSNIYNAFVSHATICGMSIFSLMVV